MSEKTKRTLVIPCSGIGKVHGLISREAVYELVERKQPQDFDTLCLALLVVGDPEARAKIQSRPCVTIDGCPKMCAQKNVELAGGSVRQAVRVVDAFKNHRGADVGTATSLSAEGWVIAGEIADGIAASCRPASEG